MLVLLRSIIVMIFLMAGLVAGEDKGIVLVLGGGGARGMTHIGVLKVLEENKIPIKFIIGTSAGAMVGGAYCAGLSPSEMEELVKEIHLLGLIKIQPFGRLGFVSWEYIKRWLRQTLPVDDFSRTRIPFAAVATDLETGEAVIFKEGSLVEAICASAAIPLIFQPIHINNRVYVDGGIAADLPIDIARKMTTGPIVAVVATGAVQQMSVSSKWDILSKSFYIMQHREIRLKSHLADLILYPEVGTYSMADLKHREEIIQAGEKEARKFIPQIRQLLE